MANSTWYYRQNNSGPDPEDERMKDEILDILEGHPSYGWRPLLRELRERTGERINHKRLKRILRDYDLSLAQNLPEKEPSPVRQIVAEAGEEASLLKGRGVEPLKAISTDFTQLTYQEGTAWLMLTDDIHTKVVLGSALGHRCNRKLALRCWKQPTDRLEEVGQKVDGTIVHSDQDAVYTSYDWVRRLLIKDRVQMSYSTRGAKDNPWIESLWGRMKNEIGSRIAESQNLKELRTAIEEHLEYYNLHRNRSSTLYEPPARYLDELLTGVDPAAPLSAD